MQDLFIQNFRGIRKVNPVVDVVNQGVISACVCKNIDLNYTENGDNVGISTTLGNKKIIDFEKNVIGQFESVQSGVSYWFVYAVDDTQGYLYLYKPTENTYELVKDGFTKTDVCNGITLNQGFYDWFVFTNGVDDFVGICLNHETESERVKELEAVDAEGRNIRGLALEVDNGRLVTACENRVHWSKVADIFDWKSSDTEVVTNPAYQEFDRTVTAVVSYNDMLIAFTNEYSTYFKGNPGDALNFERGGASGGGCPSFKSVIKFDNKLFYYDDVAKNVFAYYLLDSGQTRPTEGLANNVIDYFKDIFRSRIKEIELVSFVVNNKSEIWFKMPYLGKNVIIVYDYLKGEWTERVAQSDIRAISVIDGALYSASNTKILKEYLSDYFDGEFMPSEYKMNVINVGSDSVLKVPKMPLILTLDFDYDNDFYIEFIYDDRPDRSKIKRVVKLNKSYLIWAKSYDDENGGFWAIDENDENGGIWVDGDKNTVMFNLAGLLNFKQLQIRIFTEEKGQEFGIKRIELKRVKFKTKTIG
jgi:hypothetical protein